MIRLIPISLLSFIENVSSRFYFFNHLLLTNKTVKILDYFGERKVEQAFEKALKTPGYRKFLEKNSIPVKKLSFEEILRLVPETDKQNYIKKYSLEERCIGGKFPEAGNIDESAGSSGIPTNWIRSNAEEKSLERAFSFEYKYLFGNKDTIMVSAWSTGPWATGIKFCELVEKFSLVKTVGTDAQAVLRTLEKFGTKYKYIISAYPFFIESLLDLKFSWKKYDIDFITGGDGYSSNWPSKIKKKLKKEARIVSGYGCSDIDIGIGLETPFAQKIREKAAKNKKLQNALFGDLTVTPMLFQYDPSMHHIQNSPNGEFTITHLDASVVSPKIKYNVHDIGGAIPFSKMVKILKKLEPLLYEKWLRNKPLRLPFLYIAGRSDGTMSLDGANIYPQQIELIIAKHFNKDVKHFKMQRSENQKNPFHILLETKNKKLSVNKINNIFEKELCKINQDYKESLRSNPRLKPKVKLFSLGKGPFKRDPKKIKYQFMEK